jgi:hypothetical protein
MKKRVASLIVTAVTGLALIGGPAEAVRFVESARSYANCDALHKRWQYGVAKSRKAARRQVRTGHYKPHVSRAGYRANSDLDADKDGTACEVSR